VRLYIIPTIGHVSLGAVSPDDISRAMATATSPRTKNYVRSVCNFALKFAVSRGMIVENVAAKVSTVQRTHREREMPTPDQWQKLREAIAAELPCTRALLLVVAFCGLRVGEARGLRWSDFSDGHLRVRRSASRAGDLAPVKTSSGRRVVPVGRLATAALEEWRVEQQKLRDRHARRWKHVDVADLMFTTRFGTPWSDRNVLRAVHRVTEKSGLGKKSTHYLRH